MNKHLIAELQELYSVPPVVNQCARAVRMDLYHGPKFALIPNGDIEEFNIDCVYSWRCEAEEDAKPDDTIEEVYLGIVADTLRNFIESLPDRLFADEGDYIYGEFPPKSFYDEETQEYCDSDCFILDKKDIIRALLGDLIAKEFNY